jgi:hypothetical protein
LINRRDTLARRGLASNLSLKLPMSFGFIQGTTHSCSTKIRI